MFQVTQLRGDSTKMQEKFVKIKMLSDPDTIPALMLELFDEGDNNDTNDKNESEEGDKNKQIDIGAKKKRLRPIIFPMDFLSPPKSKPASSKNMSKRIASNLGTIKGNVCLKRSYENISPPTQVKYVIPNTQIVRPAGQIPNGLYVASQRTSQGPCPSASVVVPPPRSSDERKSSQSTCTYIPPRSSGEMSTTGLLIPPASTVPMQHPYFAHLDLGPVTAQNMSQLFPRAGIANPLIPTTHFTPINTLSPHPDLQTGFYQPQNMERHSPPEAVRYAPTRSGLNLHPADGSLLHSHDKFHAKYSQSPDPHSPPRANGLSPYGADSSPRDNTPLGHSLLDSSGHSPYASDHRSSHSSSQSSPVNGHSPSAASYHLSVKSENGHSPVKSDHGSADETAHHSAKTDSKVSSHTISSASSSPFKTSGHLSRHNGRRSPQAADQVSTSSGPNSPESTFSCSGPGPRIKLLKKRYLNDVHEHSNGQNTNEAKSNGKESSDPLWKPRANPSVQNDTRCESDSNATSMPSSSSHSILPTASYTSNSGPPIPPSSSSYSEALPHSLPPGLPYHHLSASPLPFPRNRPPYVLNPAVTSVYDHPYSYEFVRTMMTQAGAPSIVLPLSTTLPTTLAGIPTVSPAGIPQTTPQPPKPQTPTPVVITPASEPQTSPYDMSSSPKKMKKYDSS